MSELHPSRPATTGDLEKVRPPTTKTLVTNLGFLQVCENPTTALSIDHVLCRLNSCFNDPKLNISVCFAAHEIESDNAPLIHEDIMSLFLNGTVLPQVGYVGWIRCRCLLWMSRVLPLAGPITCIEEREISNRCLLSGGRNQLTWN